MANLEAVMSKVKKETPAQVAKTLWKNDAGHIRALVKGAKSFRDMDLAIRQYVMTECAAYDKQFMISVEERLKRFLRDEARPARRAG